MRSGARAAGRDLWWALEEAFVEGGDGSEGLASTLPDEDRAAVGAFVRRFAAERRAAPRMSLESLIDRAVTASGYDRAVLALPGGGRRMANVRKLMRLAREYERAEGRDLRGFLAYAATRDIAAAREGEAPLESEGLDAVRLMTIHRAKGLEFPVVAVADLGRQSGAQRAPLLVDQDGTAGLRLAPLGGGNTIPTTTYQRLAEHEAQADAEEERRLFYVAMTRARELLILSGGTDTAKWPAPRNGGPPIDWIARALISPGQEGTIEREWDGRPARIALTLNTPETLPDEALSAKSRARVASTTALPAIPAFVKPTPIKARPVPQRLSYSQISDYGKCGYRFYLRRVLQLPDVEPPPPEPGAEPPSLDPRTRGSIVHALLEDLDFADPRLPELTNPDLTEEQRRDIRRLVGAFARSPLCTRLAHAQQVTREAQFSFTLEPDGSGPLVRGFVDVLAIEPDGTQLVVDYKTDFISDDPDDYIARNYETQRLVYALAALRDGAPRVEVAYCLLDHDPETPVTRTYTQADAPDLADEINRLATGILTHAYPVTPTPHRELCGDCPGRAKLCSYGPDETLRPPPAPWPGVPVRHISPAGI